MAQYGESTNMSYFAKLQQNVVVSTLNNHDANLLAGATWTGASEDSLGVAGIQLNIYADQNISVTISQSMNGTDFYINDTLIYYATGGGDSWTIQATAAYFMVSATNLNPGVATTAFHLQTCLCPIVEAMPRTLDPIHHALKVNIANIDSVFDDVDAIVGPMGSVKTASTTRLAGTAFSGATLDGSFWINAITGSGSYTMTGGEITLKTGGTADSSSNLQSSRIGRYVAGSPNYVRMVIALPATVGTNIRRWGAFNATDGYFFSYDGTTMRVCSRKSPAADYTVASGAFNGQSGLTYVMNTSVHVYEIWWNNRQTYYFIDNILVHTITATASTLVNTQSLYIGLEVVNSGGNTNDNWLVCRSASLNRHGPLLSQPNSVRISSNTTTDLKRSAGNLHSIVFGKLGTGGNTMTVYDGVGGAGTVLHVSTMTKGVQASDIPFSLDFKGLPFATGLSIVTTTGTAGDFTVIYE
jgi:hypothetical protein